MYQDLLVKYVVFGVLVIDNWWLFEFGFFILGIVFVFYVGYDRVNFIFFVLYLLLKIKFGLVGKVMFGFDVCVVFDFGEFLLLNIMGNIVLGFLFVFIVFRILWGDEERFYKGYFKCFDGKYIDIGDVGVIDEDGYIYIMVCLDDIINVVVYWLFIG